jgi:uncharacterized protein
MTRPSRRSIVIGLMLLALVGPLAVEMYTDWLWFGETGYQTTFLRILTSRSVLAITAMTVAFVVMVINLRIALRRFSPQPLVFSTREGPVTVVFEPRLARIASVVVAGAAALLLGLYAASRWLDGLLFLYAQTFGDADPVLGNDVGFFALYRAQHHSDPQGVRTGPG